jgi:Spy/CpxP family protein refolding chaperone
MSMIRIRKTAVAAGLIAVTAVSFAAPVAASTSPDAGRAILRAIL